MTRPTIVALPGASAWNDWPDRLAQATGCDVCLASSREPLPQLLDRIGLERGILLGHSDGAAAATGYLGSVEDFRIRGLVLLSPVFFAENPANVPPGFRGTDIREAIGYIRVPILIVQGAADPYGTAAQVAAAQEEAYCPVDLSLIDGARHAPHLDQPDRTLTAVAGFVTTLLDTFGEKAAHGH